MVAHERVSPAKGSVSTWRILGVWAAVFVFWLIVGRSSQPSWPMAVGATAVLVSAAAASVVVDGRLLAPALAARGRWIAYVASLLLLIALLSFPTVQLIQWLYDAGEVPREVRFGFWKNVGYEAAWLALHLAGGMIVRRRIGSNPGSAGSTP